MCESIIHFRRTLMGSQFVVYTDHKALEQWLRKEPVNDKHAKMLVRLQDFEFSIRYIEGKDNVLADFASRPPGCEKATFDQVRKELDEKIVHAILRVDLRRLIRAHGDVDFVEEDPRLRRLEVTLED